MRKLFVCLMLCVSLLAYTQVYIKGVVLDSATQEPLSQSLIHIGDQKEVADNEGRFTFSTIHKGKHILFVSHVGCKEQTMKLLVNSDTFITLYLPHHMHSFHEFVTYGHEHNKEPEARLITSVSSHKLERIAATNLGDALENTTGIHFLKTGSTIAKPIINGMHSNRISVINDDSKQEGQQWGSEHAPEIDPLSAGSIEIIKGASTLRYGGDAMGGIIRVLPATFDDSTYLRFSVLSKLESNPRGGLIGFKVEKHNSNHSIGQRLVLNIKGNGDASAADYVLSNTGFRQLSGSYYATHTREHSKFSLTGSAYLQELGILTASHIGNLSDLNRSLSSDTPLIIRPFTYTVQPPSQL
ncbi:MAG: TonB-dependent receptor plug domain-containing protein, partial [Bacteroidia bacterium]